MPTKTSATLSEATTPVCCAPLAEAPLSGPESIDLAHVFAALGDPVRLRLFSIVASAGEVCSCELEEPLTKSQPTISHHTKVLADAGLIVGERRGRWMWWSVVPEQVAALRSTLGPLEPDMTIAGRS